MSIGNLHYYLLGAPGWGDTLLFVDFDGSLIKSYDNNEIQGLLSLPALPDHSSDDIPLNSQGWNWTLAEIKSYNLLYPDTPITVGPLYYTTDNKTHIICRSNAEAKLYVDGTAEIDWMDGTVEIVSNDRITHTMTGDHYTVNPVNSSLYRLSLESDVYQIRCGEGLTDISLDSYYADTNFGMYLRTISTSPDINHLDISTMRNGSGNRYLEVVIFPYYNALSGSPSLTLVGMSNLKCIASSYVRTAPTSQALRGSIHVTNCPYCCRMTTPDNVNDANLRLGTSTDVRNNLVLSHIKRIDDALVGYTENKNIILDDTLTNLMSEIGIYGNNTTLTFKGTNPPAWSLDPYTSVNPLTQTPNVIYVPSSALNVYRNNTTWSRYASVMQGV